MAFTNAWVEGDPDGNVITVSQLDDSDRLIKAALRERLEGDPAIPNLTGLIEVGSFAAAPKPRKGAARIYVDTQANILAYDATKREDGRLAIASDTNRLYHVATAGVVEIAYVPSAAADFTVGGRLIFTTAVGKIVPGVTSISFRNNADGADNLIITDAGAVTIRASLVIATGVLGSTAVPVAPYTDRALFVSGGVVRSAMDSNGPDVVRFIGSDLATVVGQVDKGAIVDGIGLSVWDHDAAVLKRVKRGAADSGGAGFRFLIVPN